MASDKLGSAKQKKFLCYWHQALSRKASHYVYESEANPRKFGPDLVVELFCTAIRFLSDHYHDLEK